MKNKMYMKLGTLIFTLCMLAVCAFGSDNGQSGANGSIYQNGVEGIQVATTPPPGLYGRVYTFYAQSESSNDQAGNNNPALNIKANVFVVVPRLFWVPEVKIFGAEPMVSFLVPIVRPDVSVATWGTPSTPATTLYHAAATHFGDSSLELILEYHRPRYDLGFGSDFIMPSGAWSLGDSTKTGSDRWTIEPDLGGTIYDKSRKTSLSVLARYEFHSLDRHQDIQYGQDFHFEWGLAHRFGKHGSGLFQPFDIGPVGYCAWKTSDDHGHDVTWNRFDHGHGMGIGPEIRFVLPNTHVVAQFRGVVDFDVASRTKYNTVYLVFSKALSKEEEHKK
jgi:hypothetical protein